MKKVIIFGATGNVGSYVTKYASEFLPEKGFEVVATGRRNTDVFDQFGVKFVQVDMLNKEDFDKLPQEDVYAVILLAATIPSYMDDYSGEKYLQTNIMGTATLMDACRKYGITRYHQVSTDEVYGKEYGLKYFIFRFPTIYEYSTFQYYYPNGVKTMRPLYKQINRAKNSEPLELWGDPNYAKDMVHVYDCAQMLCKAILFNGKDHEIYNVGTGIPVTLQEQCQAIIDVFSPKDNPSTIEYHPGKSGGGFLMDITNAKEDLGYEPVMTVHKLFEDYKYEAQFDRFKSLRGV